MLYEIASEGLLKGPSKDVQNIIVPGVFLRRRASFLFLESIYVRAEKFNSPKSNLEVLILMYQVSAHGGNMDSACHSVVRD